MTSEKRLIDANLLSVPVEFIKKHMVTGDSDFLKGYLAGVNAMIYAAAEIPTVDAVEVVRCKDCIHWNSKIGSCDEFTTHRFPAGGRIAFLTRDDDFCSYGERRIDDDGDA